MTTQKKNYTKRLVLLDAHAIIHRAYHAMPDFTTRAGEPTGGLYGVSAMLLGIIEKLKPTHIAACYDLPKPTFRHVAFEGYKGTRKEIDEALVVQIERSRDIFKAFGIPVYQSEGFEADDLLGTVADLVRKEKDLQVIIASGDMDTLQLVEDDRVIVYTLRKGINDTILYNEEAVRARFGFGPQNIPDYKGLRGDPSDNIPGIKGIGEKTATTLLQTYGDLDTLYKALEKGPLTLPGITPRIEGLIREGKDEADFSKVLATIRRDAPVSFDLSECFWEGEKKLDAIENMFQELEFRALGGRLRAVLGATEKTEPVSQGEGHEEEVPDTLRKEVALLLWVLRSDFTNPTDEEILREARVLMPVGKHAFEKAREEIVRRLKEEGTYSVYEEIEQPLVPLLEQAEKRGIMIDRAYGEELSREYHAELARLEKEITALAGHEVNINSPKQLGVLLFDELKLTVKGLKKTAGGARSTRESELEKLKDAHPVIPLILHYRELQKLTSTYIDTIPLLADIENTLHPKLHQNGTTTGRFSSSNPNIQNIPVRAGAGERVRDMFIARPGHVFVSCDYSQIEMRVLAVLANDPGLIGVFERGEDIHTGVAAAVFQIPPGEVTNDMRRKAKAINFGIAYGMGVLALKASLGTTKTEAEQFYRSYFERFPKIEAFFEGVKEHARTKGYTETFFKRRRYVEGLTSPIPYIRAGAERMAINAPVQGTAADIIKIAMKKVDDMLEKKNLSKHIHLVLQIHDELVYEVEETHLSTACTEIKNAMEKAVAFPVVLKVNSETGTRFGSMQEYTQ